MKKKKILASLVLSAMMVGTLGTSVSAAAWKPEGTSGINSTGGQGSTVGVGVVQHERYERLFLVAVPTTARQYRFYADPNGNTLENGDKFQFQREAQKFVEKTLYLSQAQDETDQYSERNTTAGTPGHEDGGDKKFEITQGRRNFSNYVAVYNAGSKPVTVNVDARISVASATNGTTIANDGFLDVQVVSKVIDAATRLAGATQAKDNGVPTYADFVEGDFKNWVYSRDVMAGWNENDIGTSRSNAFAAGYAVQKGTSEEDKYTWQIQLPGAAADDVDWINSESQLTPNGQKVTKDIAVSLEEYNASSVDANKLNEFKYSVALFALKGYTGKPDDPFWDKDILARMAVKWYISDNDDEGPDVEDVITISDLANGNVVPVSLGNGASSMNVVSSVQWIVSAEQDPNGVGFTQELLGSQVTYKALTASTGQLVFDQMALTTLNKYESLNGATIQVTFSAPGKADVTKAFILWVL